MKFDAYYYSLKPTGVIEVDRILSAIACAGEAFHHTDDWSDKASSPDYLRGETPIDWIQNAADDASEVFKKGEKGA